MPIRPVGPTGVTSLVGESKERVRQGPPSRAVKPATTLTEAEADQVTLSTEALALAEAVAEREAQAKRRQGGRRRKPRGLLKLLAGLNPLKSDTPDDDSTANTEESHGR